MADEIENAEENVKDSAHSEEIVNENQVSDVAEESFIPPIRQNMVDTAVRFLLNPDVRNKSENSKLAFLRKKGMTEAEISSALEQTRTDPPIPAGNEYLLNSMPEPVPFQGESYPFWWRLNRFSSSLVIIGIALYGLHRFYKLYIEPWFFGTKVQSEISIIEVQLRELTNSVVQLKDAVQSLEKNINTQTEQVERVFLTETSTYTPIPLAIADLRSEINSVKSLLINRHQFPAVPKVISSPSIPQWQMAEADAEKNTAEPTPLTQDAQENGLQVKSEMTGSAGGCLEAKSDLAQVSGNLEDLLPTEEIVSKSKESINGEVDSLKLVENGINGFHSIDDQ